MANEIFQYLIGDEKDEKNGYLFQDISLHKLIMISGAWGSGKTYFWKFSVEPTLKKANRNVIYISLYGKQSIDEIKKEVYLKAYNYNSDNNNSDLISKFYSTFTSITDSITFKLPYVVFKFNIDKIEEKNLNEKIEKASEVLNDKAIICFDDFERKSKNVDIQEILGFLYELKETFNCTVVMILDSEKLNNEDKHIFTSFKEKNVDKYLLYIPDIEELFRTIAKSENVDVNDDKWKHIVSSMASLFKEMNFKNARIYKMSINNIRELYEKRMLDNNPDLRKFVVLNTIFFSKHHKCLYAKEKRVFSKFVNYDDICYAFKEINIVDELFHGSASDYKNCDVQNIGSKQLHHDILDLVEVRENDIRSHTQIKEIIFKYQSIDAFQNYIESKYGKEHIFYKNSELLYDTFDFVINKKIFGLPEDYWDNGFLEKICDFIKTGILL